MQQGKSTEPFVREGTCEGIPLGRLLVPFVGTIALIILASQLQSIGERIPLIVLALWLGSAMIVALVFVPQKSCLASRSLTLTRRQLWTKNIRVTGIAIVPLALVPLLEIRGTGADPMIWLMDAVLVISLCSTPYFAMLSRTVVGAVALTWGALTLLWLPCLVALFQVIKRAEMAKDVSTIDTANTLHAFFVPEYRYLFYALSAMVVLVYCPVMLAFSYRRFVATQVDA